MPPKAAAPNAKGAKPKAEVVEEVKEEVKEVISNLFCFCVLFNGSV
jgi:hypothetical protein